MLPGNSIAYGQIRIEARVLHIFPVRYSREVAFLTEKQAPLVVNLTARQPGPLKNITNIVRAIDIGLSIQRTDATATRHVDALLESIHQGKHHLHRRGISIEIVHK